MRRLLLALALLPIFFVPAHAETVYVTDQLRLGIYDGEGATGNRLKMLASGDPLEIVERKGNFARVKAADGTVGWVKAAFLVTDKPAALIVAETEAARVALEQKVESIRAEYADVDAVHAQLKASLEKANTTINELETELADYRGSEMNLFERLLNDVQLLALFVALVLIALFAGVYLGHSVYERRMRRRFFGMRLGE